MAKKKITFDILNQTGTLRTVQTAFVAQARQEGWEPWEIAEVISASMSGKTLIPMAEYCDGLSAEAIEALRAKQIEDDPGLAAERLPASKVALVDLDVPFASMVIFMTKWALASIPAIILLGIIGSALKYVYAALQVASVPR